ncbi:iron complex transport system ATP-binding protein [Geomicrobium halophilum]|uniref:Iron complex transport system ATP-binding protein n=1 Tax=Geomicrobium halophilum TaxID=549000 RepID=A0A841PWY1_9BACL|nr:ABC transporter ATP-binding protein [Geomicrobium halophilum]MBB6451071.1 iron complex transport system ATP-binding protein [Geomicrobium halophilum]
MTFLQAHDLTLGYQDAVVIDDLDLTLPTGEITVFVGANGCGKSTLLRSLARLLKPKAGEVMLENQSMNEMATKDIAKQLAILPQGPVAPEGLTVWQLVKQGRYPHQSLLQQWSKQDEAFVKQALKATQTEQLADRTVHSLSGGQRQRVWIAMTLAQNTDILLLDEPTTYLDMAHQIEILDLCFDLNETEGRTVVMVLHDLNMAARYAHKIVAVKDKTIYTEGRPEDVITSDMVKYVFGMESKIIDDPLFGSPMCVPYGKGRKKKKPAAEKEIAYVN